MAGERIRDKAQDVFFGAGIAEVATSVYVHEERLALVGIGLILLSGLVEPRKDNPSNERN